jgi:hypothetical protein
MPEQLDVYRDWLGISETARPLNCYQLLRVKQFSDDVAKIRTHYQKMNAHVRKFATGDYARQSQELLNELAKAMLCLTDLTRKREYDASLGREGVGEGRRRTLEEILLAGKTIDRDQLQKARSYADAVGLEVRDALVQQKMAAPDVVMIAYAESVGLPYIELGDIGVSEELIPQIPARLARQHSCVPVMIDRGQLLMASPNPLIPDVEEELRLRLGMPVRTVLCTAPSINAVIAKHFPPDAADATPAPAEAKPKASRPAEAPQPKPTKTYRSQDEKVKRRVAVTVVAFNVAVIVSMLLLMFVLRSGQFLSILDFAAAIGVGIIAAGAAFGVSSWLDSR